MGNLHKSTYKSEPVDKDTPNFWCAMQDTVPKVLSQQDTIPKGQAQQDTSETIPEGINPLFIMIERKSAEVEAIKDSIEAKTTVARKPKPKPKPKQLDTTCYICPVGQPQTFTSVYKTAKSKKLDQFTNQYLFDAEHYFNQVDVNRQVFIETQPSQNHRQPVSISIKPLAQYQSPMSWLFYPVFSLLALLIFVKIFFDRSLKDIFRSALFFYNAKKMFREKPSGLNNLFRLLDISFYLSVPIFVIIALNTLGVSIEVVQTFYIGGYTLIGLVLLRIFRFITAGLAGFISNRGEQLKELHLNQLLYARILGIVLIPLNILALYTFDPVQLVVVYVIIAISAIAILFRLVRIVQVFLSNQLSIFYLFLYLCALEFIPLFIVFKEIFVE